MAIVNLGTISTGNVQPEFAYGVLRSSSLPIDALFLAVQGLALGVLFGNPILGLAAGVILAFTDRIFTPMINQCIPGRSYTVMGFPLGSKNIALAGASMLTAYTMLKVIVIL